MIKRVFEIRLLYKSGKGKVDSIYGVLSATSEDQARERCLSLYSKCDIVEIKDVDEEVEKEWQEANQKRKSQGKDIKQKKETSYTNKQEQKNLKENSKDVKTKKKEAIKMACKSKKGKKGKGK